MVVWNIRWGGRGKKSPLKIKADPFTWSCDPQVVWPTAQEEAVQKKIPGGEVQRGLRRVFGFGRRDCSSPHTAQPAELCRGLGCERGVCLPTASRRAHFLQRLPGSCRVCCCYSRHPPARSPGSEQPDWHCSVLQRGKKEFSPLQEPYHPLMPPRQPAALQDISKHPDGKARQGGLVVFFF